MTEAPTRIPCSFARICQKLFLPESDNHNEVGNHHYRGDDIARHPRHVKAKLCIADIANDNEHIETSRHKSHHVWHFVSDHVDANHGKTKCRSTDFAAKKNVSKEPSL